MARTINQRGLVQGVAEFGVLAGTGRLAGCAMGGDGAPETARVAPAAPTHSGPGPDPSPRRRPDLDRRVNEGYSGDYSGLIAGMTIATLPVLIGYLTFHRHVQSGLAAGRLR
jgi:hypothetical protein